MSVQHQRAEMYRYLVEEHKANSWIVNSCGQTPLLLAASCGSKLMCDAALEATQQVLWVFGPVRCVRVPLLLCIISGCSGFARADASRAWQRAPCASRC